MDVACCRECGSTNVYLYPRSTHDDAGNYTHAYSYHCPVCGHATPDRPQLNEAAEDVDWCPSNDVRVR